MDTSAPNVALRLFGTLAPSLDERKVVEKSYKKGLRLRPFSNYTFARREQQSLLLAFAGIPENQMESAVRILRKLILESN